MDYGENVFKLEDPDAWYCRVERFVSGHGMLDIELTNRNTQEHLYIGFRKVSYLLSGPMRWQGANFRAFDLDDKAVSGFLSNHPMPRSIMDSYLFNRPPYSNEYRLFHMSVEEHHDIIIIANMGWCKKEPY